MPAVSQTPWLGVSLQASSHVQPAFLNVPHPWGPPNLLVPLLMQNGKPRACLQAPAPHAAGAPDLQADPSLPGVQEPCEGSPVRRALKVLELVRLGDAPASRQCLGLTSRPQCAEGVAGRWPPPTQPCSPSRDAFSKGATPQTQCSSRVPRGPLSDRSALQEELGPLPRVPAGPPCHGHLQVGLSERHWDSFERPQYLCTH